MIRHLWRTYNCLLRRRYRVPIFLYNWHEPFLSDCQIVQVQEISKAFITRYVTWRSCIISSRTASIFPSRTAVFRGPSRTLSFSDRRPELNSLNQYFTVLSTNKDLSSSMHSCRDNPRRELQKIIERKCSGVYSIFFSQTNFYKSL